MWAGLGGLAGISMQNGTDKAVAALAPALLAAAPEQALKAEASEAASEPELLFAPDFIISQVSQSTKAGLSVTYSMYRT